MDKILTIIVPTYNMEKYLDKCLTSLIVSDKQMAALEVLVVNDGSKDRSSEIAHSYEQRHPQTFRVIDKENGNYGSCINRGLKEATGKYVKVLDADDYFDAAVFEKYIDFLTENDVDLVVSDYKIVNPDGTDVSTFTYDIPTERTFTLDEMSEMVVCWLWHHGIAYKTENLRKIGYKQTEGMSYTDDEWVFEPMINVKTALYFPYYLYLYLRGREGQTFDVKIMARDFNQRVKVAKSLLKRYTNMTKTCPSSNLNYINYKLTHRLRPLYSYYLIKNPSKEGIEELISLDKEVLVSAKNIWEELGEIKNRFGWCYIKDWRNDGYKKDSFRLFLARIKFVINLKLHKATLAAYIMPKTAKRKE